MLPGRVNTLNNNGSLRTQTPSDMLVEIHIYTLPQDKWIPYRKLAQNQVVEETISAGFVRVIPELTLSDLRHQLTEQLPPEDVPEHFVFIKSVGRNFTQVKPHQEGIMKVKRFVPPRAPDPEIHILELSEELLRRAPSIGSLIPSDTDMSDSQLSSSYGGRDSLMKGFSSGGGEALEEREEEEVEGQRSDSSSLHKIKKNRDMQRQRRDSDEDSGSSGYVRTSSGRKERMKTKSRSKKSAEGPERIKEAAGGSEVEGGESGGLEADDETSDLNSRRGSPPPTTDEEERDITKLSQDTGYHEDVTSQGTYPSLGGEGVGDNLQSETTKEEINERDIEQEEIEEGGREQVEIEIKEGGREEIEIKMGERTVEDKGRANEGEQQEIIVKDSLDVTRPKEVWTDEETVTESPSERRGEEMKDEIPSFEGHGEEHDENIPFTQKTNEDVFERVSPEIENLQKTSIENDIGGGTVSRTKYEENYETVVDSVDILNLEDRITNEEVENDGQKMGNDGHMMENDGQKMGNDDGHMMGNDGHKMGNDDEHMMGNEGHKMGNNGREGNKMSPQKRPVETGSRNAWGSANPRKQKKDEIERKKWKKNALTKRKIKEMSDEDIQKEMTKTVKERKDYEERRKMLFDKAKGLHDAILKIKEKRREQWWVKYTGARREGTALEEQQASLRSDLDTLHRRLIGSIVKRSPLITGIRDEPSRRANLKISVIRLRHEIEDLKKRHESMDIKLETETKLKSQAEKEVKQLRNEVSQKKISVALSQRNPQFRRSMGDLPGGL